MLWTVFGLASEISSPPHHVEGSPLRHRKQHKLAERQFDHVLQRVEPEIAAFRGVGEYEPLRWSGMAAPSDYGAMN